jgi:hypothetical protein
MRPSLQRLVLRAVEGGSGGLSFGGLSRKRFQILLDGLAEVLHNLASLLLTDLTRRRGGNDL